MKTMPLTRVGANTFSWDANTSSFDNSMLDELEALCRRSGMDFLRVNLHGSTEEQVQQMLMVLPRNRKIPPHFQHTGSVSYCVLRGVAALSLHANTNTPLSFNLSLEEKRFVRIPRRFVREMTALSDHFCFLETSDGPFKRENTIWV